MKADPKALERAVMQHLVQKKYGTAVTRKQFRKMTRIEIAAFVLSGFTEAQ